MTSGILTSFLGSLQASLSVLLTLSYGVIASQFDLLNEASAKEISRTCVRLFLPALLIHNLGSQLHSDTFSLYVPVFVWAVIYNVTSMALGLFMTRALKLPSWVTPAMTFNNTTALPLLLVQALKTTGILDDLLMSHTDSPSQALKRAQSYFLVNAMVSNSLTFALGPKLLNGHEEDAPDDSAEKPRSGDVAVVGGNDGDQISNKAGDNEPESDEEEVNGDGRVNERTSLLPELVTKPAAIADEAIFKRASLWYRRLPPKLRDVLHFAFQFCNAPLIGALIGAILGLTPALHRLFFADTTKGGYLNAWLTTSIKNVGDLFASLQVIVVGVKLAASGRRWRRGEDSGEIPWAAMTFVTIVRYIVWPAISIPAVWALASRTTLLGTDPIMWFAMMIMPTGPPAMKLTALADVNGVGEWEKMSIAKFLTLSYVISPLICVVVVASLKATEAAQG